MEQKRVLLSKWFTTNYLPINLTYTTYLMCFGEFVNQPYLNLNGASFTYGCQLDARVYTSTLSTQCKLQNGLFQYMQICLKKKKLAISCNYMQFLLTSMSFFMGKEKYSKYNISILNITQHFRTVTQVIDYQYYYLK